ncbi:CLUMA_CG004866, isoform A [Clunio marinus]|uniref:CLUMA_CG004866, isoform A n=1 Tax=Clunio marinus TaxID=568069 RepID=A0A1J1HXD1_9DIPT|nr:CLUMA_CG004866, isoform A [Clunio marinus]
MAVKTTRLHSTVIKKICLHQFHVESIKNLLKDLMECFSMKENTENLKLLLMMVVEKILLCFPKLVHSFFALIVIDLRFREKQSRKCHVVV